MRRENDFYPTPGGATHELLRHVNVFGRVLECCSGDLSMSWVLGGSRFVAGVWTNDIDPQRSAKSHGDAADPSWWRSIETFDWVVTNPPFLKAAEILKLAHQHAYVGVAMLLRLSFLEPCEGRALFLAENPPDKLIVLPRISFTGDGKTDSVTCAWFVWDKYSGSQRIVIVPPASVLEARPLLEMSDYL
jgi:hypothetical protein